MSGSIFVALLPKLLDASTLDRSATVVVIDTLRFTTTACQALAMGADSIRIAATIDDARQWADRAPNRALLCGERYCVPIEGFDLGNSPLEYTAARVRGQNLVFTTTNGTLAVAAAGQKATIVLAALVNREAVCQQLLKLPTADVTIICAGTDGEVAAEDVLAAGAIARRLLDARGDTQAAFQCGNDACLLALACWDDLAARATSTAELASLVNLKMGQALGGRHLIQAGFTHDVQFASELDSIDLVPQSTAFDPHIFSSRSH